MTLPYNLSWRQIVVDAYGVERTLQRSIEVYGRGAALSGARALVDQAVGSEVRIEHGQASVVAGLGQILTWNDEADLPPSRGESLWGKAVTDRAALTKARIDMVAALAPLRKRGLIGVSEAAALVRTMEILAMRQ